MSLDCPRGSTGNFRSYEGRLFGSQIPPVVEPCTRCPWRFVDLHLFWGSAFCTFTWTLRQVPSVLAILLGVSDLFNRNLGFAIVFSYRFGLGARNFTLVYFFGYGDHGLAAVCFFSHRVHTFYILAGEKTVVNRLLFLQVADRRRFGLGLAGGRGGAAGLFRGSSGRTLGTRW